MTNQRFDETLDLGDHDDAVFADATDAAPAPTGDLPQRAPGEHWNADDDPKASIGDTMSDVPLETEPARPRSRRETRDDRGPSDGTWNPAEELPHVGAFGDGADVGDVLGISVRPRRLQQRTGRETGRGDYEILRELGQGAGGIVYEARQTSIDRHVAVKRIKRPASSSGEQPSARSVAQLRRKFLAEAVVAGDLDHPNIVPVYDLGVDDDGSVFYSMKHVDGTPWCDVIGERTTEDNLEILLSVADAVAFAHSRGVVHRDLKPENVMLGEFGEVLLMDWGLALTTEAFTKAGGTTRMRGRAGTPAYMAPEMAIEDISGVGPHSDVYLLGAILHEVVTGNPPHPGLTVAESLRAAQENVIVSGTSSSDELLRIALVAMATDPADRPADVAEFQAAIRAVEPHAESRAATARAAAELEKARETEDHVDFARAVFGFEEAHELWDENDEAREGVAAARLAYAECALRSGDLDLAAALLLDDEPAHDATREAVALAKRERVARTRRMTAMRRFTMTTAALLFLAVAGAAAWVNHERSNAVTQRDEWEGKCLAAWDDKKDLEALRAEAERNRAGAEQRATALSGQLATMRTERDEAIADRDDALMAGDEVFARLTAADRLLSDPRFAIDGDEPLAVAEVRKAFETRLAAVETERDEAARAQREAVASLATVNAKLKQTETSLEEARAETTTARKAEADALAMVKSERTAKDDALAKLAESVEARDEATKRVDALTKDVTEAKAALTKSEKATTDAIAARDDALAKQRTAERKATDARRAADVAAKSEREARAAATTAQQGLVAEKKAKEEALATIAANADVVKKARELETEFTKVTAERDAAKKSATEALAARDTAVERQRAAEKRATDALADAKTARAATATEREAKEKALAMIAANAEVVAKAKEAVTSLAKVVAERDAARKSVSEAIDARDTAVADREEAERSAVAARTEAEKARRDAATALAAKRDAESALVAEKKAVAVERRAREKAATDLAAATKARSEAEKRATDLADSNAALELARKAAVKASETATAKLNDEVKRANRAAAETRAAVEARDEAVAAQRKLATDLATANEARKEALARADTEAAAKARALRAFDAERAARTKAEERVAELLANRPANPDAGTPNAGTPNAGTPNGSPNANPGDGTTDPPVAGTPRKDAADRYGYDPRWQHSAAGKYHFLKMKYKVRPDDKEYAFHYALQYDADTKHVYYYDPTAKRIWGRYRIAAPLATSFELVDEDVNVGVGLDLKPEAFGAPGPLPKVPGAIDATANMIPPHYFPRR